MPLDAPSSMQGEESLGVKMVGGEGVVVVMMGGEVDA